MKKSYHIITIGCQMNKSDSERIASYLEFYGFKNEPVRVKSDIVIINTCGVRQTAEDRNYGIIPRIKKENKKTKIILAGCLAGEKNIKRRLADRVDIWLPIKELPDLYKKLGLVKKKIIKNNDYLRVEPKVNSSFSVFIPVGNGCNNFCTYCFVPFARGREVYRSASEIISEAERFVKKGYREITLIAQNVNSYISRIEKDDLAYFGKKSVGDNVTFPEILEKVAKIEGNFWVRFSTSHPKDMSDELIKLIGKNDKICNHVHLPIQAGDDEILEKMNRKYTCDHYLILIDKIRKYVNPVSITTDLIVGFPGENKKQFEKSAKLFRKIGYDMAYIGRFSPRPGTKAAKMDDNVTKEEKTRREDEIMKIVGKSSLKNNKKLLNKNTLVLIEGKDKKGIWYGKNELNKVIKIKNFKNHKDLVGKFVLVEIIEAKNFGLSGNIFDDK